jgi:hypothetical protein
MTHIAGHNQEYERRQIVARMGKAGYFRMERKKYIIWQFMTFWTGPLTPAIAAEFVRPADIDEQGFLRIEKLRPGEILVTPGLVYRKVAMTGIIMAEHLKKMKRFRPRDVVEHFKDTAAGAVDLGTVDLRTEK